MIWLLGLSVSDSLGATPENRKNSRLVQLPNLTWGSLLGHMWMITKTSVPEVRAYFLY